jgi:two-component system, OmpR family, alkaline phosphatase synthesis response regulator PhoP
MLPRPESSYVILVVDDDPDLLPFLETALQLKSDFQILTATNGLEAIEKFYDYHPDCVLIDMRMPQLDGVQVVRILRGDPETADTPVVMLTAMIQDSDHFAGMAAGADMYIAKPVEPDVILGAIRGAISLSGDERALRLQHLAEEQPSLEAR